MNFSELLGRRLKDDEIIEVLEDRQIDVVYGFDKSHENMDDIYWASAKTDGFLFRFDKDQVLNTIFLYVEPSEGFNAISRSEIDVRIFQTYDAAEEYFKANRVLYNVSSGRPGTEKYKWWIKADCDSYYCHYEFKDGKIFRITLIKKSA